MRKVTMVASALVGLVSLVSYLLLIYKAGCAGDLKVGRGDLTRALHLENFAMMCLLAGWIAWIVAAALQARTFRLSGIAIALLLGPALWVAGIYVEGLGNTECLL